MQDIPDSSSDNPFITEEDRRLFRESVGQVKRIFSNTTASHNKTIKSNTSHTARIAKTQPVLDMLSDETQWLDIPLDSQIESVKHTNDNALFKKLKKGQFLIDDSIDLHGLTIKQARDQLAIFLAQSQLRQYTCLLIIHGKGNHSPHGAKLAARVRKWLEIHPSIRAFINAPKALGGNGASVCVLYKTDTKKSPKS